MYTIKQAAARTGVPIALLRAWERRYGVVSPARTASGYRLYDDAAIERIASMRRLVDAGWAPSTAAVAILAGEGPPPLGRGGPAPDDRTADPVIPDADGLIGSFVEAAADLDAARLERVLDRMFAAGSFETVADGLVLPALVEVGDAWAAGRLGVAAEHAASHAVLRRLAAAYQAAGPATPPEGAILVGMPPTVRHELGALAFSTAARRAGLPILYLGPDLPVDDWVATARRTRARAAVIGVVAAADVDPARRVATALRSDDPRLAIFFGGRGAANAGGSGQGGGAAILGGDLRASVRQLEDAVGRTR